jgi:hypothetical protein
MDLGGAATESESGRVATPERRWWMWAAFVVLVVLALGGLEDGYGPTDTGDLFGSDGVQYLDCARAIELGDLRSALNPLWSQGYPLLLAVARPVFPAGMAGEWVAAKSVNFAVFCFSAGSFAFLLAGFAGGRRDGAFWLCGACVFLATQVCLGQVSRIGPDELVAGLFFLGCGWMLRLIARPRLALGAVFGLVLGLGFLAKAVFLVLGCVMLAVAGVALRRTAERWKTLGVAGVMFAAIVLGYGTILSRAVGYRTLGEAGSLNYAWHVDRLQKWVHWEGGELPAAEAWPKPWIAQFVRWESEPPEFGGPVHPSLSLGERPTVYVFHEPVRATYAPYYDPAYWYQGYRHVFRWRYQAIALGKSLGDLAKALLAQPMLYGVLIALWTLRGSGAREQLRPLVAAAGIGIATYLPVHLEGRYLSGFLAVLAMCGLAAVREASPRVRRVVLGVVLVGLAAEMGKEQRVVWSRAIHRWSYRENVEWKVGEAVARSDLPRGSEVGMISWTPNLHCDWAYLAGVRITSEIADGSDERVFWAMSEAQQREVLERFRRAGAESVLSWEGPPAGSGAGWERLGSTPMWMYRY